MPDWTVYIVESERGTLYTGITTDIQRRFAQHASGLGAKYFRGRRPLEVIYREGGHTRSTAGSRELEIKTLARTEKLSLVASGRNEVAGSSRRP